jgi:outer membrane protein assembly factor BamB
MWDWDCSWYQGMGNQTINGAQTTVFWKTCKNGYLYELNAANGKMIWAWTPPSTILPRCPYCYILNPLNRTQMTLEWPAPGNADYIMNPSELAGFESTASINPATNMIYVTSHNVPALAHYVPLNSSNYATQSGVALIGGFVAYPDNATIEAINAATGQMVWSHYLPTIGFRGGMMSSGNVVYEPIVSGDLLLLNAQTGAVIKDLFLGAPMQVVPAIGATTSGVMEIILPVGVERFFGGGVSTPGDIIALTLQNVGTTTTTAVSTTISTTTAVSTTTAISTTTVGGGTSTVTVSGSATTIISSTSTGVSSTTLYGVAAVAVILAISTGYLAMRGRKPAS